MTHQRLAFTDNPAKPDWPISPGTLKLHHKDVAADTASSIAAKATAATYAGGAGAVIFGLSASEFGAFVGASVAVLGLIANIWFRWQSLQVERARADYERQHFERHGALPPRIES